MHAMCMTHGMVHAMWICPVYKNGIGGGKERKKKREEREKERKGGRKEDLTASFFEFRHSDGRSSSDQELKLPTLQEVGIFSYYS